MQKKLTLVDKIIQNRVLSHILFWLGCLIIFTIIASLNSSNFKEALISYLGFLPSWLFAGYLLIYYQVPKYLLKKKYWQFALSFSISVYLFSVLARLSSVYFAEPFFRDNFEQESLLEIISDPLFLAEVYFPNVYVVVFLMLTIKVIKDRFEEKHRLEVMHSEKMNTELKFLKAQIHPHFLFNTLNSLYALTLTKSDDAPEVVVKLSEMLDYMLYQCNEPTVSINKEVELLQGYIDLETLRYGDKLDISFNHNLVNSTSDIAPLILLSFVENAFKHGASGNATNPKIKIDLIVIDGVLHFEVFNTKSYSVTNEKEAVKKNGIGSVNAKRQLELNYKDSYDLKIHETNESYLIRLKIELK